MPTTKTSIISTFPYNNKLAVDTSRRRRWVGIIHFIIIIYLSATSYIFSQKIENEKHGFSLLLPLNAFDHF